MKESKRDEGEVSLSGQVAYKMTGEKGHFETNYGHKALELLSRSSRLKGQRRTGIYEFRDGEVSRLQTLKGRGRSKFVSLRFNRINPRFLDSMITQVMSEAKTCSLSCTLKGSMNFERMRKFMKDKSLWYGERKDSFSSKMRFKRKIVNLIAYPSHNILTFSTEWRKGVKIQPSIIIQKLLRWSV